MRWEAWVLFLFLLLDLLIKIGYAGKTKTTTYTTGLVFTALVLNVFVGWCVLRLAGVA